ncbi:hypothetical protein MetMK1DRAFT_00022590 [Metallosphaera yellowstonensis MK1]|jgi:hypothetical protein|uniref:Uncharacterized protein n=1 Tax=Metallosphaera yellowstonensis MK1 TaxID=671065 RepID=H2C6R8_9CREN|nr:hypothetical protein [Metallosphaera yellowstonensis]EHP69495.1 hypothetical protein MetMK1DRAFT_00022590 [Metallosphaera yellowstonensis MK1]
MFDLSTIQAIMIASVVVLIGSVVYLTFTDVLVPLPAKKESVRGERRKRGVTHGR